MLVIMWVNYIIDSFLIGICSDRATQKNELIFFLVKLGIHLPKANPQELNFLYVCQRKTAQWWGKRDYWYPYLLGLCWVQKAIFKCLKFQLYSLIERITLRKWMLEGSCNQVWYRRVTQEMSLVIKFCALTVVVHPRDYTWDKTP